MSLGASAIPTNDSENLGKLQPKADIDSDWDFVISTMFDESLNPQPYVDLQAPEVIAPIPEVVAPEHAVSNGPFLNTEDNHDIEVVHMGNDSITLNMVLNLVTKWILYGWRKSKLDEDKEGNAGRSVTLSYLCPSSEEMLASSIDGATASSDRSATI
ncbi:hypothetical protein Tco_1409207 [Tanacetum coccineum]